MLNKVLIQGRIATDIDLKNTQNGIPVSAFRVAVERDVRATDGTREADFINVVAFRGSAEFVKKYFCKGDMILIDGRLRVRDYTDKDNNKRTIAEVIVASAYFGGSKKASAEPKEAVFEELNEDGELPF